MEYKELASQQASSEEKRKFFMKLDSQILEVLIREGYTTIQIKAALMRHSPVLRNQNQTFIDFYIHQQVFEQTEQTKSDKKTTIPAEKAYMREKVRNAAKIMNFYLKFDRSIACQLFDQGKEIKNVQEGILKSSLFSHEIQDPKLIRNYCDQVMEGINWERILRSGKVAALAEDLYLKKSANIQNKYAGYAGSKYNEFREGKVILPMMVQDGFFPEIIAEVLCKCSRNENAKKDQDYARKIVEQCKKVKEAYLAIACADPHHLQSHVDCYRLFAKEYMQKMHIEMLNGKAEQKIIQRMFGEQFKREEILKVLREASPVAIEPGRKPEKYIAVILAVTEKSYAKKMAYAKENYPQTVALYEEKIQQRQQLLAKKNLDIEHNRSYYDGIIVRELLEMKQYIPNIIKAIVEKSPQAIKKSAFSKNKTPEGYAKWIVLTAQKALSAEKAILGYRGKLLPQKIKDSYQNLLRLGYQAQDLYRAAIKERIQVYPSVALSLNASYVDKDVCEKLLTKYPDFKLDDLKNALYEVSPRAQMPGISAEYPDLVVDEVVKRLKKSREQENRVKDVQREYLHQCGLASEGVELEANMLAYHDGRAALTMLNDGVDQTEIRNAIASGAEILHQKHPDDYAEKIMWQVEKVQQRIQEAKEYVAQQAPQNAVEECQQRLHNYYEQRKFISSSIDAAIAVEMMLLGAYQDCEIKEAIKEYSPIAVEPGRGDKYGEFIEEKARETVREEHRKLKQYTPVPRLEKEESAQKEYAHHVTELKNYIHLPLTASMDLMIAHTMLNQGFKEKELSAAFDHSVCAKNQKNYGADIVRDAKKNLTRENEQVLDRGREIQRIISN